VKIRSLLCLLLKVLGLRPETRRARHPHSPDGHCESRGCQEELMNGGSFRTWSAVSNCFAAGPYRHLVERLVLGRAHAN
jgi:hypothetical protein